MFQLADPRIEVDVLVLAGLLELLELVLQDLDLALHLLHLVAHRLDLVDQREAVGRRRRDRRVRILRPRR